MTITCGKQVAATHGKSSLVFQQENQPKRQQTKKENTNTHDGEMVLVDSKALLGSETAQKMSLVVTG